MEHFDTIGDVHGQAAKLERLLRAFGYEKVGGVYGLADRTAVFVGDLIDRGPAIGETLEIVKAMVDAGSGVCAMGNHGNAASIRWQKYTTPMKAVSGRCWQPTSDSLRRIDNQ